MNLEDIHGITKHLQPAPIPAGNPWNNASKKLSISKKNDLINDQNDNNIKIKQIIKDKENIEINDIEGNQKKNNNNWVNENVKKDIDLQQLNDFIEETRNGINNFSIKYNNKNDNNNNNNYTTFENKRMNKNTKKKTKTNTGNEKNYSVNKSSSILPIPSPNLYSQSFYLTGNSNHNRRLSSTSSTLSSPSITTPKSSQFEFTNLNNKFNNINPVNFNSTYNPYIRNGFYHPIIEQNGYQQLPIQPRIYYSNQINDRGHIQPYFPMMIPNGIPIPINTPYLGYNNNNQNNNNYQFLNDNVYYRNISPTVQTPYNEEFSDYEEEEEEEEKHDDHTYKSGKDEDIEKFNQLISQIKYYFSVENLCKDMYLRKQMDNEGFIPISIIKNFSRVKKISNGENDKVDLAIENIKELEKKGDKLRIREGWDKWILKRRD